MDQYVTTQAGPQSSATIVALTGAGALYTTDFIPKFIDKGAAMFVLTNDGIVRIYDSTGEVALELPATSVEPTKIGGVSLKTELNLNGQPYIFRLDPNASNPFIAASAGMGGTASAGVGLLLAAKAQERTRVFFDTLGKFQTIQPGMEAPTMTTPQPIRPVDGQITMPNLSAQPTPTVAMANPQVVSPEPGIVPNETVKKTLRKRAIIYTVMGILLTIWGGMSVIGTLVETFPISDVIRSWAFLIAGLVLFFRGVTGFVKLKHSVK